MAVKMTSLYVILTTNPIFKRKDYIVTAMKYMLKRELG